VPPHVDEGATSPVNPSDLAPAPRHRARPVHSLQGSDLGKHRASRHLPRPPPLQRPGMPVYRCLGQRLLACSQNGYLSSRGGCQNCWHSLVDCDHGDSTTSRFDSPLTTTAACCLSLAPAPAPAAAPGCGAASAAPLSPPELATASSSALPLLVSGLAPPAVCLRCRRRAWPRPLRLNIS
jgi:hypothetical protein